MSEGIVHVLSNSIFDGNGGVNIPINTSTNRIGYKNEERKQGSSSLLGILVEE